MRLTAALVLALLVAAPATAQKLRPNGVRSSKAIVYVEDERGRGKWRDAKVKVDGDGIHINGEHIPFGRLGQVVYERRSARAGVGGVVRVRHVLTLHMPPRDGAPGRFIAMEFGKDVAELTANRIQAGSGIAVERRESVGS
jgi:hypothetical protein